MKLENEKKDWNFFTILFLEQELVTKLTMVTGGFGVHVLNRKFKLVLSDIKRIFTRYTVY